MTERQAITGGCQCGAIRYRLRARPEDPSICHCRMCQKAFGTYFAPLGGVRFADFEITRGELAIFRSSDAVERGFCRDCGTPLSFHYVGDDRIDVSLGSLDDPAAAPPVVQYGLESRMPWIERLFDLPGRSTDDSDQPERLGLIRQTNRQHPDHDTRTWPERDKR